MKRCTPEIRFRVVFLDIDGVLVTGESMHLGHQQYPFGRFRRFDPHCVAWLNVITEKAGAVIVVSSVWREGSESQFLQLAHHLYRQGVTAPVIGRTKRIVRPAPGHVMGVAVERGIEIQEWLDEARAEEIESFVIIDDDSDMVHLSDRLVQTDFENGLTAGHADRAVRLLVPE
jgi:hypothetical protein